MSPLPHASLPTASTLVDDRPAAIAPDPDPAAELFSDRTLPGWDAALRSAAAHVRTAARRADGPFTGITPDRLRRSFAGLDLDRPLGGLDDALDELDDLYLRDAVWFHDPSYVAHLNCPILIPAIAGELILSSVNTSMDTWDQSAGATLIERSLIDWTAGRIGLGADADGVFTSGGSQSNLQALLLARDEAAALHGLSMDDRQRMRILVSEVGHFSVEKSARILGLAPDAVIRVPADDAMRMRVDALERELARCSAAGLLPIAVVATAGTTDFGSVDPLPAIGDVCRREGIRLHVDAAYGGGLLTSLAHRHLLDGIEHADSVTVDYHKTFFQPVSSSALIVRDGRSLRHATLHADYLNPADRAHEEIPNQVDKSLQTTRRFDALKLWLTLRTVGADGVGRMLDDVIALADRTWLAMRRDPALEVVVRPEISALVFRYVPAAERDGSAGTCARIRSDAVNRGIRQAIQDSGRAMVAATRVDGRAHLKLTLLNPATTDAHIREILGMVVAAGDALDAGLDDAAQATVTATAHESAHAPAPAPVTSAEATR
ncbi:aspartate aminotransferase family protein [Clavibacter tessellarius]|uniref:Pyridoxal-dependent decarboxylase n=1 Tax=Clavibacter tessellarius TaxID=31965 RepID=A0A225C9V6_9MICO|nr:aspartate aminotransferase family protein [Clavibacter michiganensis]OQJ63309.1 pyridoxal-dependent decarboxylase [Clavibacter michiganensis subsp. tessellarius]UKF33711.1 aspartate aminotransferase family protein [Clavibacter michiganensis subsp. tessellarius]